MSDAIAAGEPLRTVVPLVWQIREQLFGKTESSDTRTDETQTSDTETEETVALLLGLHHLRYLEGRSNANELLTHAFHIADSYVCKVDSRPFLRLRRDLEAGNSDGNRLAALFVPYTSIAERFVQQWGLSPGELAESRVE